MDMIEIAIKQWTELADRKEAFAFAVGRLDQYLAREAEQDSMQARSVVNSLLLTLATGVTHCSCTNPPHPITKQTKR